MPDRNIAGTPTPPPCSDGDVAVTPRRQWLWYRLRECIMMMVRALDLYYGVAPLDTRRGRER